MAKAEKIVLPPKPAPSIIVLTLSEEEAKVVRDVIGSTIGSRVSRRRFADSVYLVLKEVVGSPEEWSSRDFSGNVKFTDQFGG